MKYKREHHILGKPDLAEARAKEPGRPGRVSEGCTLQQRTEGDPLSPCSKASMVRLFTTCSSISFCSFSILPRIPLPSHTTPVGYDGEAVRLWIRRPRSASHLQSWQRCFPCLGSNRTMGRTGALSASYGDPGKKTVCEQQTPEVLGTPGLLNCVNLYLLPHLLFLLPSDLQWSLHCC